MDPRNVEWIRVVTVGARAADHIWPEMAACEAALESGFGSSALAREGNNLFGMKQHKHPIYGTMVLPTREYIDSEWKVEDAGWIKYPSIEECFEDRMNTLTRLKSMYPHYQNALRSDNVETYIEEVSQTWSTDPERAQKVMEIYDAYNASLVGPQGAI
jgi:flagellum-specific peptidoglycan hydrolase FlgJ